MTRDKEITATQVALVAFVVAACHVCSCAREPSDSGYEEGIAVTIVTSEPPSIDAMPITSCTNLDERDGVLYWKGSNRRFTGRTVLLPSYVEGYRAGEPDMETMGTMSAESFPAEQPFQDAVREQVKRYGPTHNMYFFYQEHGSEGDIPVLLYGLQAMGETTNHGIVCTRSHCVDALSKITGTNVGYNYSDWAQWWRRKYGTEPVEWKPERKPES